MFQSQRTLVIKLIQSKCKVIMWADSTSNANKCHAEPRQTTISEAKCIICCCLADIMFTMFLILVQHADAEHKVQPRPMGVLFISDKLKLWPDDGAG